MLTVLAGVAAGQEASPSPLPTGRVVDSVVCVHDPSQSYALYLPSGYDTQRRWPILYAFAPNGRGSMPVNLFSEAAEDYGYIVVGSNNSKNGPMAPILAAMDALWRDTQTRFAIDPNRIYSTGSSGATSPAILLGFAQGAGVIACAGALDARSVHYPKDRVKPLSWFGVAGIADFNYPLMESFGRHLQQLGVATRFVTFDGRHSWPPKEVARQAIEWMEIQAIKSGDRKRDPSVIDALFQGGLVRAREREAAGRVDEAATEYAALARDFAELKPVAEVEAKARALYESKQAKTARRCLKEASRRQQEEMASFAETTRDLWSSRIERLKKEAARKPAGDWICARRVLDYLHIVTMEAARESMEKRDYAAAIADFRLSVGIEPSAMAYIALSRALALQKDKRKAIDALRSAVAAGLRDRAVLEREKDFDVLRQEPEYLEVLESIAPPE